MAKNYTPIDTETSIKNRGPNAIGTDKASPHCPDNRIVWFGAQFPFESEPYLSSTPLALGDEISEILIVGANIKFDLLYLMKEKSFDYRARIGELKIWDIQLAEYILTGQTSMYASLDNMAIKYGGTVKDERLKELWNANVDTEHIAPEIIKPYLAADLANTELVFKHQIKLATEKGMLKLIQTQMDALLATIEMEYNGLKFDGENAFKEALEIQNKLKVYKEKIENWLGFAGIDKPNPNSNEHISLFLFGGTQKITIKEDMLDPVTGEPIRYKTGDRAGEIRQRNVVSYKTIPKIFNPNKEWATKKPGIYSVDEEVLLDIKDRLGSVGVNDILETILNYRSLDKELNTYYLPYVKLQWPHDGCIHGKINHTATVTGRLSSTAPNLQNITNKDDE